MLSALLSARGLSAQAQPAELRPLHSRLGLGSVLRGLSEAQETVTVMRTDGERRRGRVGRVGKDFLELSDEAGTTELVPFSALAAVRR